MAGPISTEKEATKTRGSLTPASLYATNHDGTEQGLTVHCSFNPYEYTVSKSNSYDYKPKAKAGTKVELKNSGPQTLKLSLVFDAYENGEGRDVSKTTKELWTLMTPDKEKAKDKKPDAPYVMFKWGVFQFLAVITNMTQKFTLFDHDGVPLRAKVDVTFTQHESEREDYGKYAKTKPPQIKIDAQPGDRMDSIAAKETGDPANWRGIAQHNNITNPLALRPGQQLTRPR